MAQARLFGPDQQVVGEGDEVQEGGDGMELPRAQVLDVVNMPRLGEKGFDGGAFVVEGEQARDAPLGRRQGGIEEGVIDRSVRLMQFVDDAAIAVRGGDFDPLDGLGDGAQSCTGCARALRAAVLAERALRTT